MRIRKSMKRACMALPSGESPRVRRSWKRVDRKLRRALSKVLLAEV